MPRAVSTLSPEQLAQWEEDTRAGKWRRQAPVGLAPLKPPRPAKPRSRTPKPDVRALADEIVARRASVLVELSDDTGLVITRAKMRSDERAKEIAAARRRK